MRSRMCGRSSRRAGRITSVGSSFTESDRARREPAPKSEPALVRVMRQQVSWACRAASTGLPALRLPEDLRDLVDQVDELLARLGVDIALGAGGAGRLGGTPEQVVDLRV